MSENTPTSAPASASEAVVNQNNMPGEANIDQGVAAALESAEAAATAEKEAKEHAYEESTEETQESTDQAAEETEESIEEVLEDFAEIWKSKKGKEVLKVNGKQREIQDYNDMVRLAQLGLAANEKFQQASNQIKQAEAIVQLLQSNPEKALERLGHNVREMAENVLRKELEREVLTDEQRKVIELEQKLAEYETEKKRVEDQEKQNRISELQKHYETELSDKIIKAIETYKLPRNERTISRIAEKLYVALENGYEIDPLDVAPLVRQEVEEEIRMMSGSLDVESMLAILGEDNLKKIREHELKRVKSKAPQDSVKTTPVAVETASVKEAARNAPKKRVTDFFDELAQKYK